LDMKEKNFGDRNDKGIYIPKNVLAIHPFSFGH
jgi:hypothetical protein